MGWRRHAQSQPGWVVAAGALMAGQALVLVTLPAIANSATEDRRRVHGAHRHRRRRRWWAMLRAHRPSLRRRTVRVRRRRASRVGLGMGCVASRSPHAAHPAGGLGGRADAGGDRPSWPHPRGTDVVLAWHHGVLTKPIGTAGRGHRHRGRGRDARPHRRPPRDGVGHRCCHWPCPRWVRRGSPRRGSASHRGVDRAATRRQQEASTARCRPTPATSASSSTSCGARSRAWSTGRRCSTHAEIAIEARLRMWESVRRELARMQRLLSDETRPVAPVDLDEALKVILEVQRLKGREVEFHTDRRHRPGAVRLARGGRQHPARQRRRARRHGEQRRRGRPSRRRTVDITVTDNGSGIPDQERERIFLWGNAAPGPPARASDSTSPSASWPRTAGRCG